MEINSGVREEVIQFMTERAKEVGELKPGKTTLKDALNFLEKNRGSVNLTLNIQDPINNIVVMSNTTVFAHFSEDKLEPGWYQVESNGVVSTRVSKASLDHYVLDRVLENGIHLIFSYQN